MGIPFYFGEIISRSVATRKFNIIHDSLPKKCSRFYLDFNSIIHPCSARVIANLGEATPINNELYNVIFDKIAEYTFQLIDFTQPSDLLYIAIDGVAPRAKMNQQRKRRYLSSHRNDLINDFKKKNNVPITKWDSNCITPGTVFMTHLDNFMNFKFVDMVKTSYPNIKNIIVSGSNEKGEGEHKMIHYIKKHPIKDDCNYCDVIYGLDADLIMLSLTVQNTDENSSKIVLMRESQDFGSLNSKESHTPFKYMDIPNFKESIVTTMKSNISGSDDNGLMGDESLTYDYVFICFMLGNDFIPSLSFLKIKEGAVDALLDCYKSARALQTSKSIILKDPVHNTFQINTPFLICFIEELMKKEDQMMTQVQNHYMNLTPRPQRNFNTIIHNLKNQMPNASIKEVHERAVREFSFDIEEYPLRNKAKFDINPQNDKKWRNAYYHYVFGSNSTDTIKDVCANYIDGLLWTTNYYFDINACDEWYYKYHYAPSLTDIYKFLMSQNIELTERKRNLKCESIPQIMSQKDYNYASILQLLLVLPPQSSHLLPSNIQPLMTNMFSGCIHEYPWKFQLLTYLKTKMWECCPNIPNINKCNIEQHLKILMDDSTK
jgi:5'-3' exoribonuclease 1